MNLETFLADCAKTVYEEEATDLHQSVTLKTWAWCKERMTLPEKPSVLDLGCGAAGVSIEMFIKELFSVTAVTADHKEYEALMGRFIQSSWCRVIEADMHDFWPVHLQDLVWARHVLEHSPVPLYVLKHLLQVLKPGGYLYVEVPSPDTASSHEINPNHYSVFGKRMWESLIERAGFSVVDRVTIEFKTALGKDQYFAWLCQKKG